MQLLKAQTSNEDSLIELWKNKLKNSKGTAMFAYILSKKIATMHEIIIQFIKETGHENVMSADLLTMWIESTLAVELGFYIARVYVYEMHSAKQRNLLIGNTPKDKFDYFLNELAKKENLEAILEKYGALNLIINELCSQFASSSKKFITRLIMDIHELRETFFNDDSDFILKDITPSGDKHCDGDRVLILSFTNKKNTKKILYKPKPLGIDISFQKFLHWMNENCSTDFYCTKIICKNSYGWCEFIEYKSCDNEHELKEYYFNLGAILAITYILNGTDLHAENIIAHGRYPVIVDYECFLTPLWNQTDEKATLRPLVSKSLILPYRTGVDAHSDGYDISGLSVKTEQKSSIKGFSWTDELTDNMLFVREDVYISGKQNSPISNRENFDLQKYKDDFINGFELTYRGILSKRELLLDSNASPLHFFKDCHVRVLFRPTVTYGKLLMESNHPKLLLNQSNLVEHFQFLKKLSPSQDLLGVLDSEVNSLMKLNVPLFFAHSTELKLYDSFRKQTDISVEKSGYDCVIDIIKETLSESDLHLQLRLINNSFKAAYINDLLEGNQPSFKFKDQYIPKKESSLLEIADSIMDTIAKSCIYIGNKIYWPTITIEHEKVWAPALTTPISLFSGNLGIALSFAWASKIFKNDLYRDIAQDCIKTMREYFKYQAQEIENFLGFHSGAGGILFILGQLYKIWHDEAILEDILKVIQMLDEYLDKDYTLDIIGGSAGCILGLHSVRELIDPKIIEVYIEKCVNRIIKIYPDPTQLPLRETQISSQPLLGFSHGIAGFSYALTIANKYMKQPKIMSWIKSGLEYERKHYNEDIQNWADFRIDKREIHGLSKLYEKKQLKGMIAWCHGASGIALGRMGMKKFSYNDEEINDEITKALSITMENGFNTDNTCLCHGLFGNIDTLLIAKNDGYINQEVFDFHLKNIHESICRHGLLSNNQIDCQTIPGLMLGGAGVVYQLMRIMLEEDMPSILIAT